MEHQERLIPFAPIRDFLYHGTPLLQISGTPHPGELNL